MTLKLWQKNILSAIVIIVGGFILFNLAFLLAALVINATMIALRMPQNEAPPIAGWMAFVLLIFLILWLVFRSRLNDTIKATFFTMPLMGILVMVGASLHQQSKWIITGIGALIICMVILYLYKKKLSWLYYFSAFYVGTLALYILISGVDI